MEPNFRWGSGKECAICGARFPLISQTLKACRDCIINRWEDAQAFAREAQARLRDPFGLPRESPKRGVSCGQCVNMCMIEPGERGFCGVRGNLDGKVVSLVEGAVLEWYYDPLPTNCVADWVCPGGTGIGYPRYTHIRGPEYGYKNLAVFYGACNFSCLFCQNWHFRHLTRALGPTLKASELASKVDSTTSCICFFGGDPTPQVQHALETSKIARERGGILRICFETNGSVTRGYLKKMAEVSYESGGCIKFDLKAWHENLNLALCGVSNRQTLENFTWLSEFMHERGDRGVHFLVASTLLVPGYVTPQEVESIASFVAECDPDIPYSLLAFHPHFHMVDMPFTSAKTAEECERAARASGLKNVRMGNVHLLA